MPKANAQRLTILAELRLAAGLTLSDMAHRCGLRGNQSHQSAGAWERGEMIPNDGRRRPHFLGYLWDDLGLRRDPAHFEKVWDILVEEWQWEPISDREWAELTSRPRSKAETTPAPALTVGSPAPFQAPALVGHFVGRETTLTQLTTLLTAPSGARTVALVGMGGVGKSTLAIHAAHALREHFVDGVLWAQTAISAPLDILQSWARAFGYDYSGLRDVESCGAALRSALATKCVLFMLDDVGSVQRLRPLLLGGKQSSLLLTTRSEDVAVGLNCRVLALAELAAPESVQLLVKLLGATRVTQEEQAAFAICNLLHHLPLAVEIVGQLLVARSRRPLAQMAEQLGDVQYRLDLQVSDRDVRTSFLISWEALDQAHRRVFTHLALFGGRSFTADALAGVLGETAHVVLDQLDLLVARSLVKAVEDNRYRQHPLLADFALEQLGDARAVWQRFAEYYLAFARAHQTAYAGLEPEWDNVMAAMATSQRLEQWALVVNYAEVLTEPWFVRGRYTEARQGYAWATDAASQLGQPQTEAAWHYRWGQICLEQKEYQAAQIQLQQANELALDSPWLQSEIQLAMGRITLEQIHHAEAEQVLQQALMNKEQLGDEKGVATALFLLADIPYYQADYVQAEALGQRALAIQNRIQDLLGAARSLALLAQIALVQDQFPIAEKYIHRGLSLCDQCQDQAERTVFLYHRAEIARQQGAFSAAQQYGTEAYQLCHKMGDRQGCALALRRLSTIYTDLEEYELALTYAQQSLQFILELGMAWSQVYAQQELGDIHLRLGEVKEAHMAWQTAMSLAHQLNHPLQVKLAERLKILH